MANHIYTYQHDTFSLNLAGQYTLLLQVLSKSSAAFAITHHNKILAYNHQVDLGDNTADITALLNAHYQQVVVGLPATAFMLVPSVIFDASKATDMARFLNPASGEKVFIQPFDKDNHIVYKADQQVLSALPAHFDLGKATYACKGWAAAIAAHHPADHDIYLNMNSGRLQVLNFNQGVVRFYNQFECNNEDELVYFTSLAVQELQLNAKYIKVVVSGSIQHNDTFMSRLGEFYDRAEINNMQVLPLPEEIAAQQALATTALSLCASLVAV
jgi:hypothetical protein